MKRTFQAFDSTIQKRAESSIAHSALTNSKRPSSHIKGFYPTHLTRGHGPFVWDTKGNRYIDFICGLGCSILGYAQEEVNQAIHFRVNQGITLSLGTPLEVECAEKIKEMFPWVDKVRFLKTGSDACTAALKIARATTGRYGVFSEGYHGWHDDFISLTEPALGVVKHPWIKTLKPDCLSQIDVSTAAVIVEPVMTDFSKGRIDWLNELKIKCKSVGALLIFDEVITGFRFPKFSVSEYYGIEPDLICLGKAMANGLPLSSVAGKTSVMERVDYFVSSTFAGETLSLAAATKTMSLLQTKYSMNTLWERGAQFLLRFNSIDPSLVRIEGYPTRGMFRGDNATLLSIFFQEACRAGILFGPSFFFNFTHMDLIDPVISTCKDIVMKIKTGSIQLEGEPPQPPFAQKVRASL